MPATADEIAIPPLLRASQGAYRHAIDRALADAGCPVLPRGGVFLVAALVNRGLQPEDVVSQMARGQRADQVLDELSRLAVLQHTAQGWDATDLGRRAGAAIASAIAGIDTALADRVGTDGVAALRRALVALCDIRDAHESH